MPEEEKEEDVGGGRGNEKEVTVTLLEGEEVEEVTGTILGEKRSEWVVPGWTRKEVEEVAVLEGRWRRT